MYRQQKTIKNVFSVEGLGLHSGDNIRVTLNPLPADSGLWFSRGDLRPSLPIAAVSGNVSGTTLATSIGQGAAAISTIEHLMAALGSLGLDNLLIEVSGPEMPIFDGSAAPWLAVLKEAGIRELAVPRAYYRVARPFKLTAGDKSIEVRPSSRFTVETHIDFDGVIGQACFSYIDSERAFEKELSPSRTFCRLKDVEMMQSRGLAKGGSLNNAVVVGDEGVLNPEGLRFQDEFVRHKTLDFLGDIALSGPPVIGRFILVKPGHDLNQRFLAAALAEPGLLELRRPRWQERLWENRTAGPAFKAVLQPAAAL